MGYNLPAEMFSEWAIGGIVIAVRLYARWKVGKGKFDWDDLFLSFATISWTLLVVTLYLCTSVHKSNIGLSEETAMEVPNDMISDYRSGSIDAFIAWICYIAVVWLFKWVLMFLYMRITKGLWEHRLTIAVAVFSVMTFVASMLLHLCICHPIQKNWQIKPYAGDDCTLRPLNYIIIDTLSIYLYLSSSKQELLYGKSYYYVSYFRREYSSWSPAVLRAYYSVKDISTLSTALGWASRESIVSALTVCAPGIKPLISSSRWFSTNTNSGSTSAGFSSTFKGKRSSVFPGSESHAEDNNALHPYELSSSLAWSKPRPESRGESQEHIVLQSKTSTELSHSPPNDNEIVVTTDVTLPEAYMP
ncbi:uncharacterized protein N7484_000239 [Penicillium longicatenatum]|uniref:uncharacterized protein n=1 Tax=Penicillium longicatenatum TaxID=1561947 RepID=UPI002547F680|nr:uncharacterized protein N7484_000239 [Penicillium longicatenatum]KAJ5660867.1 hypothetical protein N7484_000239 [Penicillium longicatenatum]